jgi:TonB family protein
MIDQALHILERFGYHAIAWFWIPMLIWTICLVLVYPVLKLFSRLHPNYQYHSRLALFYALPVGLLLFLIPFHDFIVEGESPLLEAAMTRTLYFNTDFLVTASQTPGSWYQVLCTLVGAVSLGLIFDAISRVYQLLMAYRDLRTVMRHSTHKDEHVLTKQLHAIASSMGIKRLPRLFITRQVHVPLTFGFLKPVVVIPEHILENPSNLHPVFLHELIHIQRFDYVLTWAEQLLLSIGGVNPALKHLCSEIEDYREQSCDAAVLVNSHVSKYSYASMLFSMSQYRDTNYGMDLRLARNASGQLRRRIVAIKNMSLNRLYENHRFLISKMVALVILLLVSGTLAGAYHMNFNKDFNPATRIAKYKVYDLMPSFLGFESNDIMATTYPSMAMLSGTQGLVMLDLKIDSEGKVSKIRVVRDPGSGLGTFARKQIERARFTPAIDGGTRVESNIMFPILFDLTDGQASVNYGVSVRRTADMDPEMPEMIILTDEPDLTLSHQMPPSELGGLTGEPATTSYETEIFLVVEDEPQLIGGLEGIQRSVRYPDIARRAGIEGRVFVQFVVNERGEVENPVITRGIGGGCDEAALEAVKQARFVPGKQRGRAVKVQYSLPVTFKLAD